MIPVFTFFAVDKGNMTLVQFSNGINMLIDCRCSPLRPSPLEYLKPKVKTLDFVVITHPHQDHLTGLKDICQHYRPKFLWHNGRYFRPDPIYEDWSYYEALRNGQHSYCTPTAVRAGQTASIGQAKLHILGPKIPYLEGTSEDENNNSLMLKITVGSSSIVLTGDTQGEQWDTIDGNGLVGTTALLASHHGRESGFSERALRIIQPQLVIISDGESCDTDVTHDYAKFSLVKTTRNGSLVIQPQPSVAATFA
jgi:competence protein ComEC